MMNVYRAVLCLLGSILSFNHATHAQVFFDDFDREQLDTSRWSVAHQKWGEPTGKVTHGGVIRENVFIRDGNLVIRALGEHYKGPLEGHGSDTRVGGALYTKEKYASGSFEVRAKICPHPGALSAFWTYYYENDDYNHEIDFEFPGRNQHPFKGADSDITWGLMSNWRGVHDHQRVTVDKFFGYQNDGEYHLYRFDWYTGDEDQPASIEWYYDNKLMHRSYEHIPTHASSFWLGIWFPTWIAQADFDTEYMLIDWVRIVPFNQRSDER
ncbi:glycoside hydrolase family 16 protein [Parapedobacter soli]|uniref:glycoside hydrolase family 16 protein n=1 Tax=Parapedobacter soli TaxID=416955 RepID=UPI0021C591C3|nr:glycoside hydrolase family 16 protein [Parapedobacter soli]